MRIALWPRKMPTGDRRVHLLAQVISLPADDNIAARRGWWYGGHMTDIAVAIPADQRDMVRVKADQLTPDEHREVLTLLLRGGQGRSAFHSIRAMRRLLERMTWEAYQGHRSMKDLPAMAAALKTCAELFIAEKQLSLAGLDIEESQHALGPDGGLPEDQVLVPRGYVHRVKSYKKGTGARGTPVDEVKVVEEGGSERETSSLPAKADDFEQEF